MPRSVKRPPWYAAGLYFGCLECGACCSGPDPGYIWVRREEIRLIADFLGIPVEEVFSRFLKRVGFRTSIAERPGSRDCMFLERSGGRALCAIYPVRPAQCRNWPFWAENLKSPASWNRAAAKCPGINRGRHYDLPTIDAIRRWRRWWP
jgi:Fe-S-cluster containining protein